MAKKRYTSAISFLIIVATIYYSFTSLMPSKISDISTPLSNFSTERALLHLKEITKKPHYTGSYEHKNVQNYIVKQLEKLGLETQIQQQVAISKKWRAGANTQNILARIKGTDSSKALLLLSHYDSSPHSSLGASDAGSGVVTILEGIRAFLATDKQPKNDIIILITDAEELGLLGANAFVNYHPWAKDVGLVLNFEARGSGGPSYMLLETNGGNKNLIQQFNKANPKYPAASSLMYSIYKMLPNDTDLTVFREDGDINGFNFAFIDDHFDYHTAQDNYKRLDRNTLEHQGSYLMPLLHYFANADLTTLDADVDYVYFNFRFLGIVSYPFSWILPMLILTILLFIGLIIYGFVQHRLSILEILKGFIPLLLSLLVSGLIAHYGWKFLKIIYPQYHDILHGFTYNGHLYILFFSALTIAITFYIYRNYFLKTTVLNLSIPPIILWILINIAIAFFLKGAAYFIIAALYGILILALSLRAKNNRKHTILFTVLSIPLLLIFVPMVQMFPIGLGLGILAVSTTFIVLIFGLLIPVFASYKNRKSLQWLFFMLALISFITASFKSDYNENRKKPNSIVYVLDADKNEAYWASYNTKVDEFTKQFLGDNPVKGSYDKSATISKYRTGIQLHKKTKVKNITPPEITIFYDTIIGDYRNINFSIIPKRNVNRIELKAKNNITFLGFKVNDIDVPLTKGYDFVFKTNKKRKHILSYYITDAQEVLNIRFSIPKDQKPSIVIKEISYDLLKSPLFNIEPLYHITPRNKQMIPTPFVINDAIIVKKQLDFK